MNAANQYERRPARRGFSSPGFEQGHQSEFDRETLGYELIDSAPRDGTVIDVKRIYNGEVIYDGPAQWRKVHFGALPPDPLGRARLPEEEAYDDIG